jgi:hypothetical protein
MSAPSDFLPDARIRLDIAAPVLGQVAVIHPRQPREQHHPAVPKHPVQDQLTSVILACDFRGVQAPHFG